MHKNKSLIITSWYYARPLSHNIHKLTVPFSLFIQLIFTVDLFSIFTFRFPFQVRTIAYLINRIVGFFNRSEANDLALRIARAHTKHTEAIVLEQ